MQDIQAVSTQPCKFNTPGKRKLNSDNHVFHFIFPMLPLRLVGYILTNTIYIFNQLFWYCVDTVSRNITTLLIFHHNILFCLVKPRGIWDLSSSARGRADAPSSESMKS